MKEKDLLERELINVNGNNGNMRSITNNNNIDEFVGND